MKSIDWSRDNWTYLLHLLAGILKREQISSYNAIVPLQSCCDAFLAMETTRSTVRLSKFTLELLDHITGGVLDLNS